MIFDATGTRSIRWRSRLPGLSITSSITPTVTRGIGSLLIKKLMILRIITPEGVCEIWKFGKKTNRWAFLVGSMTLVNCSLAIKEADIIYQTPPKIVNIFWMILTIGINKPKRAWWPVHRNRPTGADDGRATATTWAPPVYGFGYWVSIPM